MKIKKILIYLLIAFLILTTGANVFAVTSKNEVTNETIEDEVSDELEESEEKNTTETKKTNKKSEKSKNTTTKKASKKEIIDKDIVSGEADKGVTYKDQTVNGNIFVANGEKVIINNVKVDGDVVVFASKVEIIDSQIKGNVYATSGDINIENSEITSMYVIGDTIVVGDKTEISRELRVVGANVTIEAEIERDAYIISEKIEIGENTKISGNAVVKAEDKKISDDADINNLDYEKIEIYNELPVNIEFEPSITSYLTGKGTEVAIILLITIFVLCGLPKFTEVNSCLRLRDFVKAFFTGILEFLIIIVIAVGLFFTIYGIGYGLILLNLLISFVCLGKVIFIISFAIRLSCNPEKISKIKAFFTTVLVALCLALIEMITLVGEAGIGIDVVLNIILALTGFGSMFRVIFTSKKKMKILSHIKLNETENKIEEVVLNNANVVSPKVEATETAKEEELQAEIKAEIKEEINELKQEREEEKKLENNEVIENSEKELKEENNQDSNNSENNKLDDENK